MPSPRHSTIGSCPGEQKAEAPPAPTISGPSSLIWGARPPGLAEPGLPVRTAPLRSPPFSQTVATTCHHHAIHGHHRTSISKQMVFLHFIQIFNLSSEWGIFRSLNLPFLAL